MQTVRKLLTSFILLPKHTQLVSLWYYKVSDWQITDDVVTQRRRPTDSARRRTSIEGIW